jgi:hypothetical protein
MQNQVSYTPEGLVVWPFPVINGQQTEQSKALQADKGQHKPTPYDLSTVEDALL